MMLNDIGQNKYSNAVSSYTALNMSSKKIRGILIDKKDKNITIDIGNNKGMTIELIKDISMEKGEPVLINRRNIVKSKIFDLEKNEEIEGYEKDLYTRRLKELGICVNENNIKTIKKLDSYGIAITKENFETYSLAKSSLNDISSSLDYDSAIKLVEMDIDIENESVDKIASTIKELKDDEEGASILKEFKKEELTTEDAEEIAKKIYGSKMGKDITDIIKSLHKKKVNITKQNIEKINDVFYKLDNLKDVEDVTFIDTIKNKLDVNIDNLYKIKRYVKNEEINIETDINNMIKVEGIQKYESLASDQAKAIDINQKSLEEDIKSLMVDLDLDVSEENINLSKEFIKRELDITKEKMLNIIEFKKALEIAIVGLDKETAAQLINENIDIENTDIREVAKRTLLLKQTDNNFHIDIETETEDVEELMNKINSLKNIEEKDIITLLEKNVDFKINKIEQVILGKNQIDSMENSDLYAISKITTVFNEIGKLDFNTIAFQMKKNIPMTLMNIKDIQESLRQDQDYKEYGTSDLVKALSINELEASRINIQKSMQVYRSFYNIKENLTSNIIKQAVVNDIEIENMNIELASKYIDEYRKSKGYTFVDSASEIIKNSDECIMYLMKNKSPLSFKELRDTNAMFKNENQIGHKIEEISTLVDENGGNETKEKFEQFKQDIMKISKSMKGSKEEIEEAYKHMEKSVKDMEENFESLDKDHASLMKNKSKEISKAIDDNRELVKENKIIQFPLYMNGQFTNLNMYFRDRQNEGSKKDNGDISAMLSIDTVNMGNVNINIDIKKKNVDIKINLENKNDKSHIESYKNMLVNLLEQDGYKVNEISFHNQDEINFLNSESLEETSQTKNFISNSNLDIKI